MHDPALSVFVRGLPAPQGSMKAFRHHATGRVVVMHQATKRLRDWRQAVAFVLQAAWPMAPLEGPVCVNIVFELLRPASVSARRRPRPSVKPDIDKLARSVLDAMTGIVYRDDAQIVSAQLEKRYGPEPGVHISVTPLA
jgi:Holliday junction resolvase RusA-like endonuclease